MSDNHWQQGDVFHYAKQRWQVTHAPRAAETEPRKRIVFARSGDTVMTFQAENIKRPLQPEAAKPKVDMAVMFAQYIAVQGRVLQ